MKKTLVLILALVACSLWMHSLTIGQTAFTVPIYVTDGTDTDTLTLGVNASATFGTDDALGEKYLPPAGVAGVFDARFVSPRGDTAGFDQGRTVDIRPLVSDCSLDSFAVAFQPGNGSTITISWGTLPAYCTPTRWRLSSALAGTPEIDLDMTSAGSVDVDYNSYSTVYIRKGDGKLYRTFDMNTLALDGYTVKGKKTYGKSLKLANSQTEFTATFKNTTGAAVNALHVEFKLPLDSMTLEVSNFTVRGLVKAGKYDKWNFSGATIDTGATVTISAYGIGAKLQTAAWWWMNGTVLAGTKQKTATFTKNINRLPMPNTINLGEQMFAQLFTPTKAVLAVGVVNTVKPIIPFVTHAKYADVLKSLVLNAGKFAKGVSTQVLHDTLATSLNIKDDKKLGLRGGKPMSGQYKTLAPSVHRNKLFGQALTLGVNLKFSVSEKVPAGLGALTINSAGSPFNGWTLNALFDSTGKFLTYGTGVATAEEFFTMCKSVNEAFNGSMDTLSWSDGGATKTGNAKATGVKAIADVPWLVRNPNAAPQVIADLSSTSAETPLQYSLDQNYPNPFNPTTNISFTLPVNGLVTVKVFNLLGQEVATLINQEEINAGATNIEFNASSLSSGVYFYRINVSDVATGEVSFQDLKKMVLLK